MAHSDGTEISARDRRISDQLVRLVQTIFGLVLAQSLLLYREVVVHPFSHRHWLATLALATVYLTVILSWVDWHVAMELRPYAFSRDDPRRRIVEQMRLLCDVGVVTVYAYTLFTIAGFESAPSAAIWRFIVGFPLVFVAYLLSGALRILAHDGKASRWRLIVVGLGSYVLLLGMYLAMYNWRALRSNRVLINTIAIVLVLGVMLGYRWLRSWRKPQDAPQPVVTT